MSRFQDFFHSGFIATNLAAQLQTNSFAYRDMQNLRSLYAELAIPICKLVTFRYAELVTFR